MKTTIHEVSFELPEIDDTDETLSKIQRWLREKYDANEQLNELTVTRRRRGYGNPLQILIRELRSR